MNYYYFVYSLLSFIPFISFDNMFNFFLISINIFLNKVTNIYKFSLSIFILINVKLIIILS